LRPVSAASNSPSGKLHLLRVTALPKFHPAAIGTTGPATVAVPVLMQMLLMVVLILFFFKWKLQILLLMLVAMARLFFREHLH